MATAIFSWLFYPPLLLSPFSPLDDSFRRVPFATATTSLQQSSGSNSNGISPGTYYGQRRRTGPERVVVQVLLQGIVKIIAAILILT